MLSCLGNIVWFIFGGLINGLSWLAIGVLWCLTIIGIPVGLQCFKMMRLSFFPFGKDVVQTGGTGSIILNIIWIIFGGIELAVVHLISGLVLLITIIGIPFARQQFKLALLALFPFGTKVVPSNTLEMQVYREQ